MSKIRHILSVIHYTICGAVCFQFTHFLVMIERIYILCLIIIIKSDIWTITNCLGLGHETMVCAVCLFVFLWSRLLFKMAMLGQFLRVPQDFEIFDDRLFWPGLRDDVTALTLRISGISLKFGGMLHSNMNQIAIYNGHAQPILARSTALWNFQNRLRTGLRDNVTALTLF